MALPALKIGQTVKASTGKETHQGILRYIGPITDGPPGDYCGIELPEATGKNNGSVKGKDYFRCPPGHGIFVKKSIVTPIVSTKPPTAKRASVALSAPASSRTTTSAPASRPAGAAFSRASTNRHSISRRTPVSRPSSQAARTSVASSQPPQVDEQEHGTSPGDDMPPPAKLPGDRESAPNAAAKHLASYELDQLKVKLHAMEKKRIEDRDKIKQIDTIQSENERLNNIIKTLQAKLRTTTEERKEAQAKVQEMEQRLQAEPETPAQLESELELANIDKEMAEERVESLQHELDILKAKYEELELETEILREENRELGSTMTEEEKADAGWIHLERERDRLREALLLLRDHKQELETELREEIDHLQSNLTETEEAAAKYLETAEQLHRVEDSNVHLREQLEAAENQEEIISNMMQERDRHLAQIEDLRASLLELEELAQTNEDLEKLYLDNEKGLLSRLDEQEAILHERERKTVEQDRVIEDLEFTLNKFRSVVQGLQSDIDEARRTREISELQAHEMNSRSKAMMDLNLRLQNNAAKSQTKAIDIEMVRAQAILQERHIDILSLFLPESFDSERTPITALLSFSRLKTKAGVVANMLFERLRERPHLSSGEEILSSYEVVGSMQWIQQAADRFERFMSACSPNEFAAFSNAGQELEPVERAVTNWLESLKNDELGIDGPEHMRRMQSILADMTEKLIPVKPETAATYLVSETKMIATYTDIAASLLDWLAKAVKSKFGEPDDDDAESIAFDRKADHLSTRSRTIKLACAKVTVELEKRRTKNICLSETTWPLFVHTEQHALTVSEQVQHLCQVILGHLNELEQTQDAKPSYSGLFDVLSSGNDDMFTALLKELKTLNEQVENLSLKAFDQSTQLTFESQPAPWTVRAKDIKAQRQISNEVEEELAQSVRRSQELAARISEKERHIEELLIRAELAEKRVKENKSREGQDKAFREEIERLAADKSDLETLLSAANAELLALQEENRKDKAELALLQSTTSEMPQGTHTPSIAGVLDPAVNDLMSAQVKALNAQIADLGAIVRHLRWENRELSIPVSETKFKAATEMWLDPANLKPKKSQSSRLARAQQAQNDALDALLELSKNLKPVRLKETWPKDEGWRSVKKTTRYQVLRQKEQLEAWGALRDEAGAGFMLRLR